MPSTNSGRPQSEHLPVFADLARVRHIRNTAIVSRDVAGETIVVPICSGGADLDSVYMFNPVGQELWVLLAECRTGEELAKWVTTHYQVEAERAFADVYGYLAELRKVGLIHTI
jgi:Coenzyme PQQ synthesis protein D (PqqD)